MTDDAFCQNCGTARAPGARFCASCGRPFEEALYVAPEPPPVAAVAPATPGRSLGGRVAIVIIGVAMVSGLLWVFRGQIPVSTGTVTANDIPPVGQIWFGDSFNTTTFAIAGRKTAVGVQDPFSFVAHLPRSVDGSEIVFRVLYNGALVVTQAANVQGSGDVFGFSPGPLSAAGSWTYQLTDIGGNVLASGTVTAQ